MKNENRMKNESGLVNGSTVASIVVALVLTAIIFAVCGIDL